MASPTSITVSFGIVQACGAEKMEDLLDRTDAHAQVESDVILSERFGLGRPNDRPAKVSFIHRRRQQRQIETQAETQALRQVEGLWKGCTVRVLAFIIDIGMTNSGYCCGWCCTHYLWSPLLLSSWPH